ncbi:hypothetical protein GOV09_04290, partial [Candidatus Woesearchaeota archaeon]|nr:hypothetical protein [Candidatus Woesearchaeota archaeon]
MGWFTDYQKENLEQSKKAALPSTRYGLSIFIKPEFDFSTLSAKEKADVKVETKNAGDIEIGIGTPDDWKPFLTEEWRTEEDDHKLYYLHQAHMNDHLFIKIPKGKIVEDPIEINQEMDDSTIFSSIMILAEENSQAKILLTRTGKEKKAYISDDIRILAKKGSRLDFVSIQDLPKGNATMQKRTALVKKDAHVDWIDCVLGSVYTKSNNVNKLIEEGATGNIRVIFSGNDKQKYDLYT